MISYCIYFYLVMQGTITSHGYSLTQVEQMMLQSLMVLQILLLKNITAKEFVYKAANKDSGTNTRLHLLSADKPNKKLNYILDLYRLDYRIHLF